MFRACRRHARCKIPTGDLSDSFWNRTPRAGSGSRLCYERIMRYEHEFASLGLKPLVDLFVVVGSESNPYIIFRGSPVTNFQVGQQISLTFLRISAVETWIQQDHPH